MSSKSKTRSVNTKRRPQTSTKPNAKRKSPAKVSASKSRSRSNKPNIVPYYPNRMTVAVSALAGTLLVLIAMIAVLGLRR